MSQLLRAFGRQIVRFRAGVLALWFLIVVLAALGGSQVAGILKGGSGAISHSQSLSVDTRLYRDFDNPFTKALLVTFSSSHSLHDPSYRRHVEEVAAVLRRTHGVRRIMSYYETRDNRLKSPDGTKTALLVGLSAASVDEEEALLPQIRAAVAPLRSPDFRMAITGRSAITSDVNLYSSEDSTRAETRAVPLTLLVLVLAFGSLVAAGLPLVMGLASTTVALGVLFVLGHFTSISNLAQNVATMLGLAVGIDYSLLMVNRFREARKHLEIPEAIEETLATAGKAVVYSGVTVAIGLGGLFLTPLFETRSVGVGGILVVVIAVLSAITLVPALLAVLGRGIDWPRALSKRLRLPGYEQAWRSWARLMMQRAFPAICLALLVLGAMIAPASRFVAGFPSQKWLPKQMEARQGLDVLLECKQSWSVFPVYLVVEDPKAPVLALSNLPDLFKLSSALHQDPRIGSVLGPVDLQDGLSPLAYLALYANPETAIARFPLLKEMFISHDGRSALFQVILRDEATLEDAKAFVREIAKTKLANLKLSVGGQPVYYNDYDRAMGHSFPLAVGFVLLATFVALFIAYRSVLIPVKAIVMNLLSVGAGYGAMVAVFLLGWGRHLVGLAEPVESIPQAIPLIIFCVVFGLSMDYEVFLLSRIKEAYDETGDNRWATAEGLAKTGGIITSAALVMVIVFGAFAWAEVVHVKMLGLGLAVAVLVDATLIRCVAVPAFMRIAGHLNWWPGDRRHREKVQDALEASKTV